MVSLATIGVLFGFVIGIGDSVTTAFGADYPSKPVVFLAQSKPGSGFDTIIVYLISLRLPLAL